ncbi:MAG: hypothetical protein QW673_00695 [Candidatus Thermoplasmatota archaeon]
MAKNIAISDEIAERLENIKKHFPGWSNSDVIGKFLPKSPEDAKIELINNIFIEAGDAIEELKGLFDLMRILSIKLYKSHNEEKYIWAMEEIKNLIKRCDDEIIEIKQ